MGKCSMCRETMAILKERIRQTNHCPGCRRETANLRCARSYLKNGRKPIDRQRLREILAEKDRVLRLQPSTTFDEVRCRSRKCCDTFPVSKTELKSSTRLFCNNLCTRSEASCRKRDQKRNQIDRGQTGDESEADKGEEMTE